MKLYNSGKINEISLLFPQCDLLSFSSITILIFHHYFSLYFSFLPHFPPVCFIFLLFFSRLLTNEMANYSVLYPKSTPKKTQSPAQLGMQNLSISCALVCLIILGSAALIGAFGVCQRQISAILVTGVMYLLAGEWEMKLKLSLRLGHNIHFHANVFFWPNINFTRPKLLSHFTRHNDYILT